MENNGGATVQAPDRIESNLPRQKTVSGGRNNYLTSHAGSLLQQGCDEATMRERLLAYNAEDCDPPLDAKEVSGIARKISRRRHKAT